MTFLISITCFLILKGCAWLLGVLSALCESASWAFDKLDAICFQSQIKLDSHADRYIVREPAQTIRPNKRRG